MDAYGNLLKLSSCMMLESGTGIERSCWFELGRLVYARFSISWVNFLWIGVFLWLEWPGLVEVDADAWFSRWRLVWCCFPQLVTWHRTVDLQSSTLWRVERPLKQRFELLTKLIFSCISFFRKAGHFPKWCFSLSKGQAMGTFFLAFSLEK